MFWKEDMEEAERSSGGRELLSAASVEAVQTSSKAYENTGNNY